MKKLINYVVVCLFLITINLYANKAKDIQVITLSSDNVLSLNDEIEPAIAAKLMEQASKLNTSLKSGYPLYLVLYTPGGSIQVGLELIDFLKGLNRPVHTITIFSASMGFQMVQHLDNRYIINYGTLMSHKARGSISGEFGGGFSQLDSRYGFWLRRIDAMDKQTVKRTKGKQTLKSYREDYQFELWLNGNEAVEKGYADKVAIVKCDISLSGVKDELVDMGFFKVKVTLSNCPVKTMPLKITALLATNYGEMSVDEFLNKGGQFGDHCNSINDSIPYYSEQKPQLCASDKQLTIEKINKTVKDIEEYYKSLTEHIKYSY